MTRLTLSVFCVLLLAGSTFGITEVQSRGPYDVAVDKQLKLLQSNVATVRAGGAEVLGFMRTVRAEGPLLSLLNDPSLEVRREAVLSLGWCGGRDSLAPLLDVMEKDEDWLVRQGAWVSLTNLTGIEFSYDAVATPSKRSEAVKRWRQWLKSVPADRPPAEVLALMGNVEVTDKSKKNLLPGGYKVTASSVYRGPAGAIVDGSLKGDFWQTKSVPFPQWCEIELPKTIN